jgi:hypothetical protein
MADTHKFMGLNREMITFFNDMVGQAAEGLGVSKDDAKVIVGLLESTFNLQCAKPTKLTTCLNPQPQGICSSKDCHLGKDKKCVKKIGKAKKVVDPNPNIPPYDKTTNCDQSTAPVLQEYPTTALYEYPTTALYEYLTTVYETPTTNPVLYETPTTTYMYDTPTTAAPILCDTPTLAPWHETTTMMTYDSAVATTECPDSSPLPVIYATTPCPPADTLPAYPVPTKEPSSTILSYPTAAPQFDIASSEDLNGTSLAIFSAGSKLSIDGGLLILALSFLI